MLDRLGEMLEAELIRNGRVCWRASGSSMLPMITPHTTLLLERCPPQNLRVGDVIAYRIDSGWVVHRLYAFTPNGRLLCKGDWRPRLDPPVEASQVVARLHSVVDGPCPQWLWNALNSLLVVGVVYPVNWLLVRPAGRPWLRRLKVLQVWAVAAERVRRRCRNPGRIRRLDKGCYEGPGRGGLRVSGDCLLEYWGVPQDWAGLLEAVKHDRFGWGPGLLQTPAPEQPGWDWVEDRTWLEFLLGEGFVVRRQQPGLHLELAF